MKFINIEEKLISRNNNFDILRLFGALLVIFSHSFALAGFIEPKVPFQFTTFGTLGVQIFMLIGGFLVTMSFLNRKNFLKYMYSRCLRIFPALIFCVFLTVFILGPLVTNVSLVDYFKSIETVNYFRTIYLYTTHGTLPGVFNNNVFPAINGSLWTLKYEFTFYILIGLMGIFRILEKKYFSFILFLVVLLLNSQHVFLDNVFLFNMLNLNIFLSFLTYFLLGSCFYLYRKKIPLKKSIFLFCILILLLASIFGGIKSSYISLFLGYVTFYFSFIDLEKIKSFFKIKKLGDISYGLYIYAFPIQELIVYLNGGDKMKPSYVFFFSLPIIIILSLISWNLVEKGFLKLKNN